MPIYHPIYNLQPNQVNDAFGMQALLQTVELNLLPKSLNSFFQTNFSTSIHHKKMNIQNGICAIILNKNTEVCSTKTKRQHIKNIIHKHLYTFLKRDSSLKNHLRYLNRATFFPSSFYYRKCESFS